MTGLLGNLIDNVLGIINKSVSDKDLVQKLTSDITRQMISENSKLIESEITNQANVIISESKGESFLQRNWRPILMLVFTVIIGNNYILAPYLKCIWPSVPVLELPPNMWDLIKLGVGGYIVGRSVEKSVFGWKGK